MTATRWKLFSVKLTPSEGWQVKRNAKAAGLTPHAYLRNIIRAALAAQKEGKS